MGRTQHKLSLLHRLYGCSYVRLAQLGAVGSQYEQGCNTSAKNLAGGGGHTRTQVVPLLLAFHKLAVVPVIAFIYVLVVVHKADAGRLLQQRAGMVQQGGIQPAGLCRIQYRA